MPIDHSRLVGFTEFRNATFPEIHSYFTSLANLGDHFSSWAKNQANTPGEIDPKWVKDEAINFLGKAEAQFGYYRDELLRIASEIKAQLEDRHIIALRAFSSEVQDFDETCVRFKNHVVYGSGNPAGQDIKEIYAEVRDRNFQFWDVINAIPRLRLLKPEPTPSEILSLKPEFYGFSIDLKGLFGKIWRWIRPLKNDKPG